MRKVILMMLLAVNSSAMAEWVGVGYSPSSGYTAYTDINTIRENGNMVKMWSMNDFKTYPKINGKPFRSMRIRTEYDCKEEQTRTLYTSFHSGNLGNGELVESESTDDKWLPVPPGTTNELLWKIACGKLH